MGKHRFSFNSNLRQSPHAFPLSISLRMNSIGMILQQMNQNQQILEHQTFIINSYM